MDRKNNLVCWKNVSKRQNVALIYLYFVVLAFVYTFYSDDARKEVFSDVWYLIAGFFFGNVLGFYITVFKYRISVFNRPSNLFEFFNYIIVALMSLVGIISGLNFISGDGHQLAVIGAVAAVTIFIPATFESWLIAKQEYEYMLFVRSEIRKLESDRKY